jgi:hypothetical protein
MLTTGKKGLTVAALILTLAAAEMQQMFHGVPRRRSKRTDVALAAESRGVFHGWGIHSPNCILEIDDKSHGVPRSTVDCGRHAPVT